MKCLQLTHLPIVNNFLYLCLELGLELLCFITVQIFVGDMCTFPHLYEKIDSAFVMFSQASHRESLSLTYFKKYTNNFILSPILFSVFVIRFDYFVQRNSYKEIINSSCWFLRVSSSALS